jgi:hypothetical protein
MIKSRRMRRAEHVAGMGEKRNACRILVVNPERKRPVGRPRRRLVDNIKMELRETGWDSVDWIDMTQDIEQWRALVNTVLNLRGFTKCWQVLEWLNNWRLLKECSAP